MKQIQTQNKCSLAAKTAAEKQTQNKLPNTNSNCSHWKLTPYTKDVLQQLSTVLT